MQTDPPRSPTAQVQGASVGALWRYPVKSMMGEELNAAEVTERGLLGDRRFAVVDRATGKIGVGTEALPFVCAILLSEAGDALEALSFQAARSAHRFVGSAVTCHQGADQGPPEGA